MTAEIGQYQAADRKGVSGLVRRVTGRIRERIEIWRMTRRLLAADDYLLKDIGISRCDIEWVVRRGRRRLRDPE